MKNRSKVYIKKKDVLFVLGKMIQVKSECLSLELTSRYTRHQQRILNINEIIKSMNCIMTSFYEGRNVLLRNKEKYECISHATLNPSCGKDVAQESDKQRKYMW